MIDLCKLGVSKPKFETHDWGMYWFESDEESPFREGHIDRSNTAFEWPFDQETKTSNGSPVKI